MQLEHEFTVPVPPAEAWRVLLDVERVAPCMPGATLESFTGDEFTGKVKVKVGPITVTYRGSGRFVHTDESARTVTIEASGKEARGTGTASATVRCRLAGADGGTRATVTTDLNVTGRPAQFGRGVMADVGGRIIGRFASCLAEQLAGSGEPEQPAAAFPETADRVPGPAPVPEAERAPSPDATGGAAGPTTTAVAPDASADGGAASPETPAAASPPPAPTPPRRTPHREAEPVDLLETAGLPVLKRVVPVVAAVGLLLLVVRRWRRRR